MKPNGRQSEAKGKAERSQSEGRVKPNGRQTEAKVKAEWSQSEAKWKAELSARCLGRCAQVRALAKVTWGRLATLAIRSQKKLAKKKFPANGGNGFRNCGLSRKVFVPIKYRNCNFFSVC